MQKLFIVFHFLLLTFSSEAQLWTRLYGDQNETSKGMCKSIDGGYILTGSTSSYGELGSNFFVIKTDSNGVMVWQKSIGASLSEDGVSVVQNANGDIFVLGNSYNQIGAQRDLLLVKMNSSGNVIWTQYLGGSNNEYAAGIVIAGNDVVIAAETRSYGAGLTDVWLMKIDSAGNSVWSKTIGTSLYENPKNIANMHDGGFLITGNCNVNNSTTFTAYAIRTDASGDTIWTKAFSEIGVSTSLNVGFNASFELKGDTVVVLTGISPSFYAKNTVVRMDLSGNVLTSYISNALSDGGNDIAELNDGGFVVVGYYANFGTSIEIKRFSNNGTLLFTQYHFGSGAQIDGAGAYATAVEVTDQNEFIIAFTSYNFGYNQKKAGLLKTNVLGNILQGNTIIPTFAGSNMVCDSVNTTVSVPDLFEHYQWYIHNDAHQMIPIPNSNSPQIPVDTAGGYRCAMWNNDMAVFSQIATMTVSTMPDSTIGYNGSLGICNSLPWTQHVSLTVDNVPGTTYTWFFNGQQASTPYNNYSAYFSGNYYVNMVNACGNVTSDTVYVDTYATPDVEIGPDTILLAYWNGASNVCTTHLFDPVYSSQATYKWFRNGVLVSQNSSYATGQPGEYYVIAQNACGMAFSDTTTLLYDTLRTQLSILPANISLTGCANQSLKLVAPSDGIAYNWYRNGIFIPNATTNELYPSALTTGIDSGFFYCSIVRSCGSLTYSHETDSVFYKENNLSRIPTIQGTNPSCAGTALNLSITAPGAQIQWYKDSVLILGATNQIYSTSTFGQYYCVVDALCGQYSSGSVYPQFGPPVYADIQSASTNICRSSFDTSSVRIEVDHTLYPFPWNYEWRLNGTTLSITTADYYNAKIPGQYDCVFNNSCGTTISNSITLTDYFIDAEITPTSPVTICKGETISLTVDPGFTYQWYKSLSFNNSLILPGATTNIFQTDTTNAYFVIMSNGLCSVKSQITQTRLQLPPPYNFIMASTPTEFCGSDSSLLISNSRFDYSHQWYKDGLLIPGADSIEYNAITTGNYVVEITDSLNCKTISPPVYISNQSLGYIPLSLNGTPGFCVGDVASISCINTYQTYQWFCNADTLSGAITNSITTDSTGFYGLSVSDPSGCVGSVIYPVIFESYPVLTNFAVTPQVCGLSNGTISATFNQNVIQSWTGPNDTSFHSTLTSNVYLSNLVAGWYVYNVRLHGGNCAIIDSIEVPFDTTFTPNIVSNNPAPCQGQNVQLNVATGAPSYLWSTGSINTQTIINSTGWYTVTVSDPVSGCSGIDSMYVSFSQAPSITITPPDSAVICGNTPLQLDAGSGFMSYLWYNGDTTQIISVVNPGVIFVTVTDSLNGCTNKDTVIVTSVPVPALSITPSGNIIICQGDSVVLEATSGLQNYLWNTGSTDTSIVVSLSGLYTVTVSDINNLCSVSDSVTVSVNNLPMANAVANGPTSFCIGDSVLINISGTPGNYQWRRNQIPVVGATGSSFYAKAKGFYTCMVTDAFGCTSVSNVIHVLTPCMPPSDPVDKIIHPVDDVSLFLFPNPGSGNYTLESRGHIIPFSCFVTDLSGKLVIRLNQLPETNSQHYAIDLTIINSGIYIMNVLDDNGLLHRIRFVKL